MTDRLFWAVSILGAGVLAGVFWKMKPGFGPYNLRAVGLALVAVLACLLALQSSEATNAAMGVLGAIAGYLIGLSDKPSNAG